MVSNLVVAWVAVVVVCFIVGLFAGAFLGSRGSRPPSAIREPLRATNTGGEVVPDEENQAQVAAREAQEELEHAQFSAVAEEARRQKAEEAAATANIAQDDLVQAQAAAAAEEADRQKAEAAAAAKAAQEELEAARALLAQHQEAEITAALEENEARESEQSKLILPSTEEKVLTASETAVPYFDQEDIARARGSVKELPYMSTEAVTTALGRRGTVAEVPYLSTKAVTTARAQADSSNAAVPYAVALAGLRPTTPETRPRSKNPCSLGNLKVEHVPYLVRTEQGDGHPFHSPVSGDEAMTTHAFSVQALRRAMVAGNAGKQNDEKQIVAVKVTLVRLWDGEWQQRSDGQQFATFFQCPDGTVRLHVPMGGGETMAGVNLLVLDQGEQQLRRLGDDCLAFTEVDYSQCAAGEPDEACIEDFAVSFEGDADRDRFENAWAKAVRTNCKVLGI